ncbi:MAG TPA: ATP-binding protein [Candidatus Brocadiia bacterium]|nr:ATP-binding protein [Candidatus Brocadiia bacterium]
MRWALAVAGATLHGAAWAGAAVVGPAGAAGLAQAGPRGWAELGLAVIAIAGAFMGVVAVIKCGQVRRKTATLESQKLDLQRVNRALVASTRCGLAVTRAEDEKQLLADVCDILATELGYDLAWAGLSSGSTDVVQFVASSGDDAGWIKEAPSLEGWPETEVVRTGAVQALTDLGGAGDETWRARAARAGYRAMTALPLISQGRALGVVAVYVKSDLTRDPAEMNLLMDIVEDVAFGIEALRSRQERDRAARELEASERLYRVMVESLLDAVCGWTPDTTLRFVNNAFCQLFGVTREEIIGRKWIDFVPAPEREDKAAALEAILNHKAPVTRDVWILTASGPRFMEWSACPVFDAQGALVEFHSVGRDITERKRVQEGLEEQRRLLERAVEDRTAALRDSMRRLEEANERLAEANRQKSLFLSTMSHELRTPLNAVIGFADLLAGQFFGRLNEKQKEHVAQIANSGKHLLAMISDLLDMAKIDAGVMTLDLKPFDAREVAAGAVEMVRPQAQNKRQTLDLDLGAEPVMVYGDARRHRQVLLNLLTNAVKFTAPGGRVGVRLKVRPGEAVRVEVSDTGPGVKASEMPRLFTPFYQSQRVRDEELGGTGIGLALAKRLVELHGGCIGVESEEGKGSVFWFETPIKEHTEALAGAAPAAPASGAVDPKGRRILLAEDNEANAAMVMGMLSVHGHHVSVAHNGLEAVEMAREIRPELILMDIRMPVLDGLEATRRIRAVSGLEDTPIIALTASAGAEAESRHLAAGCTAHVTKPVESKELFAVLRRYLSAEGRAAGALAGDFSRT